MIPRRANRFIRTALKRQAAVALIGPRQVGKNYPRQRDRGTDRCPLPRPGSRRRPRQAHRSSPVPLRVRGLPRRSRRDPPRTRTVSGVARPDRPWPAAGQRHGPLPDPGIGIRGPAQAVGGKPGRTHRVRTAQPARRPRRHRCDGADGRALGARRVSRQPARGQRYPQHRFPPRFHSHLPSPRRVRVHAAANTGRDAGADVDDAGPRPGRAPERVKTGSQPGGEQSDRYRVHRSAGRPVAGAPPEALPRQHPQTAGQVPQGLCPGQRSGPRPARHRKPQRTGRPSRGRRQLGGVRDREPVGGGSARNGGELLSHPGRSRGRSGARTAGRTPALGHRDQAGPDFPSGAAAFTMPAATSDRSGPSSSIPETSAIRLSADVEAIGLREMAALLQEPG